MHTPPRKLSLQSVESAREGEGGRGKGEGGRGKGEGGRGKGKEG